MTKKTGPFHTDEKIGKALVDVAKKHLSQPINGQASDSGAAGVTTQSQDFCQFELTTNWKKLSCNNCVASAKKIVPLQVGSEKRPYLTTIFLMVNFLKMAKVRLFLQAGVRIDGC